MKVKVNVKTSPKAQEKYYEQAIAEAYAEMETMFQENKDLRVSEGHLRDDLARAEARIEKLTAELAQVKKDASHAAFATGEILLEAERKAHEQEALIAELNDQITATEEDAEFWKKAAAENAELAEQNIAQVAAWERSANELKREVAYWKCKAQEAIAELAKFDVGYYQRAVDEWQTTADQLAEKCQKFQDERDKAWAALRGLQNVESELEYYRDIAAHRKERNDKLMEQIRELETELAELTEDYDSLVQTKREYGEYIDTLRQENKRLRNQMSLPEFMRQFIEMTRETVQNEFPDSGNS